MTTELAISLLTSCIAIPFFAMAVSARRQNKKIREEQRQIDIRLSEFIERWGPCGNCGHPKISHMEKEILTGCRDWHLFAGRCRCGKFL